MRHFLLFCISFISVGVSVGQKKSLPYDDVEHFVENMAIVSKNGLFGFVNRAYQERIAIEYDLVYNFSEGVAAVAKVDSLLDEEWIFIDSTGKQAVPGKYRYVHYSFIDGLAVVEGNGKKLIINKKGETVIEAKDNWSLPFQHGFAVVEDERSKYGVTNLKGETVIPTHYSNIEILSPELVKVVSSGGLVGLFNTRGKQLAAVKYGNIEQLKNGFVTLYLRGKYGLLNGEGKMLVAPRYDQIENFEEGLAAVKRKDKWGHIDERGKEAIPVKYESASSFVNGKAKVSLGDKALFIDKHGRPVDERYSDFVLTSENLTKETAEKAFLLILNTLVNAYPYAAQGEDVLMDSLFSISNGMLTGTYQEYTAGGIVFRRLSVPVSKIQEVWYDYNMGFYVAEKTGTIQTTKPSGTNFESEDVADMLHLAAPGDGTHGWRWKEQLTIALEALKKFYP